MTHPTLQTRPDRYDVAADIVARIVDTVDRLVTDPPERRPDTVATLVAEASLLTQTLGGRNSVRGCEEIADRLWMLGMPAGEVAQLATVTALSHADGLIDADDTGRIAGRALRALRGGR